MKLSILPSLLKFPNKLLTDNSTEFTSGEFADFLDEFGITHILTTPYKPSSNGLVERANRTLTELLRSLSANATGWEDDLAKAVSMYNSTFHSELGMSPSYFLLTNSHDSSNKPLVPKQQTEFWREGNPSFTPFRKGQKVLKKVNFKGRLVADKLAERFEGPYTVVALTSKVTYLLKCDESGFEIRAHHTQLRRYYEPPNYIRIHPYYEQFCNLKELAYSPEQADISVGNGCLNWSIASYDSEPFTSESVSMECESDRESEDIKLIAGCNLVDFLSNLNTEPSPLSRNRTRILECERMLPDMSKSFIVEVHGDQSLPVNKSNWDQLSEDERIRRVTNVLFSSPRQGSPVEDWPISPIAPLTYDVVYEPSFSEDFTPLFVTNADYQAAVGAGFDAIIGGLEAIQSLLGSADISQDSLENRSPTKFDESVSTLIRSAEKIVEYQRPFVYPESDLSASAGEVSQRLQALRVTVAKRRKSSRIAARQRLRRVSDSEPCFPYHTRSKGPIN